MELRTQFLTSAQWKQEVAYLFEFLQAKGKHELVVSYGWGCDLDMDDLYQDISLPLSSLQAWIVKSTEAGTITLGESILHIHTQDQEIGVEFSDETDIQVTTDKKELAQEIASGWTARGLTYYEIIQTQ